MVKEIDIVDYLQMNCPLIDVRSPGEYEKAHIPGAFNVPLFSDEERAQVGTVYKQQSKEKAVELGYKYVNPKLQDFIIKSKQIASSGELVIHCWRGGMRSHAFAQHLQDNGFKAVSVITGGYKSYRTHLLNTFDFPFNLKIIGGYTGSGKTSVLKQLKSYGFQVIDLEDLARHKGSAFGAISEQNQPTVEQFENNLFEEFRKLNFNKPIWLEDESRNIGGVNIPMNLFNRMRQSEVFFLEIPKEERARHLVTEYAETDINLLTNSIRRISKRLGGLYTKQALSFLDERNFYQVACLALHYYDKTYLKGINFRNSDRITTISKDGTDPVENAKSILKIYQQNE